MKAQVHSCLLAVILSSSAWAAPAPVAPSSIAQARTGQVAPGSRIGVEGVVVAASTDRVVLQDGQVAGIVVLPQVGHGLTVGDHVRLSGTLRRDHGALVLRMSPRDVVQSLGVGAVPDPVALKWSDLSNPARLMAVESMVVTLEPAVWVPTNAVRAATPFTVADPTNSADRLLVWSAFHDATAQAGDLWTHPTGVLLRYDQTPLLAPRDAGDLAPSDCDLQTALALPGESSVTEVGTWLEGAWGEPSGCDYDESRESIYFDLHLESGEVEGVYTGDRLSVTPGVMPHHTVFNTEHTWPQSWGADVSPMRCDLHHLFPVQAGVNSRRSNHPLDVVTDAVWTSGGAVLGDNASGERVFEPRDTHKGNAARAILYYVAQYDEVLSPSELARYQAWSALDPVDDAERIRNDAIVALQGVSNPFITCPELAGRIVP